MLGSWQFNIHSSFFDNKIPDDVTNERSHEVRNEIHKEILILHPLETLKSIQNTMQFS